MEMFVASTIESTASSVALAVIPMPLATPRDIPSMARSKSWVSLIVLTPAAKLKNCEGSDDCEDEFHFPVSLFMASEGNSRSMIFSYSSG
jgi:hypothetical protein